MASSGLVLELIRPVFIPAMLFLESDQRLQHAAKLVGGIGENDLWERSDAIRRNQTPSGLVSTTLAPRKRIILRRSMEKASDMMHTKG